VDGVEANRDYALTSIVLEVAIDLAWPSMLLPPKLEYELRGLLWRLPETARSPRPPAPPTHISVDRPPGIDRSLIDSWSWCDLRVLPVPKLSMNDPSSSSQFLIHSLVSILK